MDKDFIYTEAYKNAQEYEERCNNSWQNTYAPILLKHLNDCKQSGEKTWYSEEIWLSEFFNSSKEEFLKFEQEISEKNNLEIGSGPFGFLQGLYWLKNRTTIEPLLEQYKAKQIECLGESWLLDESQKFYSKPSEILIPELIGKIDGFIVCRNCLDHTQDWRNVLENISKYASKGCYFMFWSDLYHVNGADSGHFNITDNVDEFKNILKGYGFDIIREYRANRGDIDFGCFAKKI